MLLFLNFLLYSINSFFIKQTVDHERLDWLGYWVDFVQIARLKKWFVYVISSKKLNLSGSSLYDLFIRVSRDLHTNIFCLFRRQPISAGTAKGFWNGITELKNVLTPGNPLLENNVINRNATFYVGHPSKSLSSKKARKMMDEEDQFFKDINTLYQRQKVLFQKCCEQLKDIYLVNSIVKLKCLTNMCVMKFCYFLQTNLAVLA